MLEILKQYLEGKDAPISYDLNASIYAWWRKSLLKSKHVILRKN